jgi:cell division protease FtsH
LPHTDRLRRVSIIPRGRALGATEQQPEEDRYNVTREQLLDRITVALGGRAAEEIALNEQTSGANEDLKVATRIARKMVTSLGMSRRLGATSFQGDDDQVFLGRELAMNRRDFSENTAQIIDEEIRSIVESCEQRALGCLREHREQLQNLATALLDRETLTSPEIEKILQRAAAA